MYKATDLLHPFVAKKMPNNSIMKKKKTLDAKKNNRMNRY